MRIGIVSDTHDHVRRAGRAVDRLIEAGAEALIHCGDLTGPEVVRRCAEALPAYFVFGNNDADEAALRRAMDEAGAACLGRGGEVRLGDRRLAVTHGDSVWELRRLAASGPDYLFSGHTHVPDDRRAGPTRWVNPGALHRAATYTVALLDLDADDLQFLAVPDRR